MSHFQSSMMSFNDFSFPWRHYSCQFQWWSVTIVGALAKGLCELGSQTFSPACIPRGSYPVGLHFSALWGVLLLRYALSLLTHSQNADLLIHCFLCIDIMNGCSVWFLFLQFLIGKLCLLGQRIFVQVHRYLSQCCEGCMRCLWACDQWYSSLCLHATTFLITAMLVMT